MKLFTALLATTLLVLVVLVASELVESPESEAQIDLSYENRHFTSDFAYDEVCGSGWGGGFLIDFSPSWDGIVSDWLPENTKSIWEIPGGFVASSRSDSVDRESIVARFRLEEGRVDPWSCPQSPGTG